MQIEPSQFTRRAAWTIWKMTRKSTWHKIQEKLWCKALVKVLWLDKNDKISYQLQKGIAWRVCNEKNTLQHLKLGKVKFGIGKIGCSMSWTRYKIRRFNIGENMWVTLNNFLDFGQEIKSLIQKSDFIARLRSWKCVSKSRNQRKAH